MKKKLAIVSVLVTLSSGCATKSTHWGYSGQQGTKNWATLSSDNFACSGKNQFPINLSGFVESELPPVEFNYRPGGDEILNKGHTVQVNYKKGSSIKMDGQVFQLLQFHFHAPSENHINGHSYPLEAHLVHADNNGNLAVVAVMFEEGAANSGLKSAWSKMPKQAGDKHALLENLDVNTILPTDREYYRFNGSLTTPPCSEGVRWLVMKSSMTASKEHIEAFTMVLHEPNNRPLQDVNARTILR